MLADVGFDPNITVSGLLVMIPATIAAVAALRNGKINRTIRDEVASTNGTSTGETIQQLKTHASDNRKRIDALSQTASQVVTNQAIHEELDKARQEATNARITIMDLRLSQNNDHLYAQDATHRDGQTVDRAQALSVAATLAKHTEANAVAHEEHLDLQDVALEDIQTATTPPQKETPK